MPIPISNTDELFPDLFSDEEMDNILTSCKVEVKQLGIIDSKENCWKYFIDKVRKMLKVKYTLCNTILISF